MVEAEWTGWAEWRIYDAWGRFATCDCLSWSFINAALSASMGVAASAAPLAGQLAGCRWALWLGWGCGFSSSVAGFRQFVKFFEVY